LPAGSTTDEKVEKIRLMLEGALILRNRIGHLEPILKRNLSEEHANLIKLVAFACRKSAGWMKAHSTLNAVLRDGPTALVSEPFFMRRAIKNFEEVDENSTLKDAALLLGKSTAPFLVVKGNKPNLLSRNDIGNWLLSKASDGIVDLDDTPLAQVVGINPIPPLVGRKASLTDLRTALAKNESRFALVTETGATNQKVLAVVDLMRLLS